MKNGPKFEFYVLNYNSISKQVEMFNIFNNATVYNRTLSAVKKYCRNPKNYSYEKIACRNKNDEKIYGFEGFCKELESIIMHEEWSRIEYEIVAGAVIEFNGCCKDKENETTEDKLKRLQKAEKAIKSLKKLDCYAQASPNTEIIARDVIYKYRQWVKLQKLEKEGE